jgi:hypothetical protein
MTETKERPDFCTDDHLTYLDELRESGAINMFGAAPYLAEEFCSLSRQQARDILSYWMATFGGDKR